MLARLSTRSISSDACVQSISYANTDPLLIVKGEGARLVDEAGRVFLDTRNNVAHVGHANEHVARAVSEQVPACISVTISRLEA